ncbi:MAG: PAS domain S-box protein [Opitutae bacterium]
MNKAYRILVVEDDPTILNGTAHLLETAGYRVDRVSSGEAALAAVAVQRPDLVLLDRDLGGIDGLEVCRQIKANPAYADMLVIMASASYATLANQSEGFEAGADGYLSRPISNRELIARISSYIRILQLTRALHRQNAELRRKTELANNVQLASLNVLEDVVAAQSQTEALNLKLAASIDQHEAMVRSISDAIISANSAGNIVGWNPGAERIFGYPAAEILGQPLTLLLPARHNDRHTAGIARVSAGGPGHVIGITIEVEGQRKDGTEFPLNLSLSEWSTGGNKFFTAIIRDISTQKQADIHLRKLSAITEQMPLSVIITDLQGRIEYANPRFCTVTGYTLPEVLNKNPRMLKSGETPVETYREMWSMIQAGQVWSGELRNRKKNGELYLESVIIAPVLNPSGQTTHYVAVKDDITAQRRFVAETTAQLAKEHELSEMKTRFISVTSHEFRTPMAAAMGSAEILINHLDHLAPAKRQELLARITHSMHRMTEMLDEVLLLNRMDADRLEVRLTPIDLRRLLVNIVDEIRLGDQQGHVIDLQAAPALGRWVTDTNLLQHILTNLLSNAVRYSPPRSVITLQTASNAAQLEIVIADQGIGIPAADQARIFEPFERGSNVGTIKGTGLGLSIVKRMAGLLGGTITLTSPATAAGGSRFTLVFPVQPEPPKRS